MNGATFFLVLNFVVAMSFATVFRVVARRSQSHKAALVLGSGFGVASMSAICELLVAYAGPPKIWALGAFATVLCGMVMLTMGIGEMYRRQNDARITCPFVTLALCLALWHLRSPAKHPCFKPFSIRAHFLSSCREVAE
jgi:hypothetical protein